MSILSKLIGAVHKDDAKTIYGCFDEIEKLGENARRNLEIGILQDELVKMGFTPRDTEHLTVWALFEPKDFRLGLCYGIIFDHISVKVMENTRATDFNYDSPTFCKDVLTKVKELINDNM